MASYVVPQVEIHQLFSEIPVALARNQVPFIFGPNFLLHRYEDAAEKLDVGIGEYTSELAGTYFAPYPGVLDEEKVDQDYTKLYGDNVVVKLDTLTDAEIDATEKNKIFVTTEPKKQKELSVGRYLRIYKGTESSGSDTPVTARNYTLRGATNGSSTESSSEPILDYVDVKITDIDTKNSTSSKICLVIDEELDFDTIDSFDICEVQNGVEFSREDVTDTESKANFFWKQEKGTPEGETEERMGVKIVSKLKAKINDPDYAGPTAYGVVYSAELYITFRELITASSDIIHSLTNASEVANALGSVSPDNPLAQAVYNAALNAGGQTIRYMAVATNDKEGYNNVLNTATLTKEVYFLVPATRNQDFIDLVQSHVNSMSAATSKRWRIAFVSKEVPTEQTVYSAANHPSGKDFQAMITKVTAADHTAEVKFVVKNGSIWEDDSYASFKKDLSVGDVLCITYHQEWGKIVPNKYSVKAIINNNTIRIKDPDGTITATTSEGEKAEILHPYTAAETAEVVRNISSKLADRRMYNVFPSEFTGSGVLQSGEFAAAAVAGLVSSCLPQQPVTNLELVGIDNIPMVYQTFSMDQLNTMASGGTFIVMQDLPGDQVYVRHQISTDYEANNLNTAELSITKNLDSISYFFDDLLSPYIGKYNITPELLDVLNTMITKGITSLASNSYGLYGSQLIAEGTEILLLEQDALLKDHVNCNLQLNMPYPFNHLVLKLFV